MRSIFFAAVVASALAACSDAPPPATEPAGPVPGLVLYNGNVLTLDPDQPEAEAVAIRGDRIVAVGSSTGVRALAGEDTQSQNLFGRTLVPGFIDAHVHFVGIGQRLLRIDASAMTRKQDILDAVAARAAATPPGEWILGRGWDQNRWAEPEFPTAADLDAVAPDHPVHLVRVDGHAGWANTRALERAGITAETPDPIGGQILRGADGEPTGTLIDNAFRLVTRHIPPPSRAERIEAVQLAIQEALAAGVTSVHEAGSQPEDVELYDYLGGLGLFDMRLFAFLRWPNGESERPYTHDVLDGYLEAGPRLGLHGDRLSIGGVKMSVDGALGSRGAALLEPYADDADNTGLFRLTEAEITETMRRALAADFRVAVHAIGDAANRMVLDAMESVVAETGAEDHRMRIEHAQILDPADLGRFAELGVVPSMQPIHATSDMRWAVERIGEERAELAYAWRSLLDTGVRMPAGSDAPVEAIDPLAGFHAAVTRREADGWPEGGWHPEQRMTREEALRAFTIDAAWSVGEEDLKGTIEVGKLADLVLLSDDPLAVPDDALMGIRVIHTYLGGELVFQNRALAALEAAAEVDAATRAEEAVPSGTP
jgi:predicted amidohydrolase YtcJ